MIDRRLEGTPRAGRVGGVAGFTLVEVLVALALSMILLAGVYSAFSMQDQAYRVQGQVTDMQQRARAAADQVVDDLQMAGYGLPASGIGSWVTWVAMTDDPEITDGAGGAPDTVSIAAAFDAAGSLAADAPAGTGVLVLGSGEGSRFNTTDRSVFFLGRNRTGVVLGVVGDVLAVDMDPAAGGIQGLGMDYPAGTPIEAVKVVTYRLSGTTLVRDENQGAGEQPVVDGIDDFQVSRAGDTVTVGLTARTEKADPNYTDPTAGDGYRRVTYLPAVNLRNR